MTQVDAIHNDPLTVSNGQSDRPPEAYVFTASSAIPVADAIRGYYEAQDASVPLLLPIAVNNKFSRQFF